MFANLFSSFDPGMGVVSGVSFWLSWVVALGMVFPVSPFMGSNRLSVGQGGGVAVATLMAKRMGVGGMQGWGGVLAALFLVVLFINLGGLIPWAFSLSSHLAFTMALAVPLWLTSVLVMQTPQAVFSRFVGTGLSWPLAALIGVIEVVGVLIRPLTLSVRLAANMMAGHIILALASGVLGSVPLVGVPLMVGLYLFEVGIACVQAYVFVLLVALYVAEWVPSR